MSDKATRGSNANTTSWAIASRQYLLQNWRADVVRATDSSGTITDRIRYTAYGEPQRYSLFDVGRQSGNIPDGSFDYDDYVAFLESLAIGDASVDPAADVDHDGTIDGADYTAFMNAYASNDEGPLGTGHLSRELDAGFRRGYAGYEFDPVLGAGSASIYHVRNRVYDAENGRWNRRDPLGYVDGMGLYQYCGSRSLDRRDSTGLASSCSRTQPGKFKAPFPDIVLPDDLPFGSCVELLQSLIKANTPWDLISIVMDAYGCGADISPYLYPDIEIPRTMPASPEPVSYPTIQECSKKCFGLRDEKSLAACMVGCNRGQRKGSGWSCADICNSMFPRGIVRNANNAQYTACMSACEDGVPQNIRPELIGSDACIAAYFSQTDACVQALNAAATGCGADFEYHQDPDLYFVCIQSHVPALKECRTQALFDFVACMFN